MRSRDTYHTHRVSAFVSVSLRLCGLFLLLFLTACSEPNIVDPRLADEMPNRILWAWERPEDLRFIDPKEYGVAFLAQTIHLQDGEVSPKQRHHPLEVAQGTYLIAVTRIETAKETKVRPTMSAEMVEKAVALVERTLDLPDVRAIEIDFDAVVSEREFYRTLMSQIRRRLDERQRSADTSVRIPLTMTSLASWCTGDAWFNDFPVDEAVPMAFQMGADSEKIRTFLRNSNDWPEPLCRGSYGLSLEEGELEGMKTGRRMYYFKDSPWIRSDLGRVEQN